jgi:DNA-binding LacI/PurR family transcriptional regulator
MGYLAAAVLIDMLEGRQVQRYRVMPAELIVRASTGPVRGG